MTENKRFTIKPQDDLFGVVDKYSPDKVCVINGIRTEIEAKWLCNDMNALNDDNEKLKQENNELKKQLGREETDKKRLMSYLMKYKGLSFDEIVEDFLDNSYYDNWWENGFYESCWDEYLKEKGFDGCDEE